MLIKGVIKALRPMTDDEMMNRVYDGGP